MDRSATHCRDRGCGSGSVGAVVNQSTDYRFANAYLGGGYTSSFVDDDVQSSRVAGGRFEISANLWHNAHQRLDVAFATSPRMHATIQDNDTSTFMTNDPSSAGYPLVRTFSAPETASLVDAQARWLWTRGRSAVSAGLRDINPVSKFDNFSVVADRNRFLLPFLGWSTKF